ncbi:MAG TPA: hypothetical protein EYQ63_30145 [Fuerstia sp.]|nr:hypothetical protein [Fuerstiella sp.]
MVKVCIRGAREADLLGKLECDGIARIHSVHADEATGLGIICMPYVTRVTMHHLTEWLTTFADATSNFGSQNATELMHHVSRLNDVDPSLKEKTSTNTGYGFVNPHDDYSTVILKWGITLANALAHAHHKDVLHLDVKPGNVLILPDLSVSLLDFNLASSEGDDFRLAGGTLPYMASEQLLNLLDSMTESENANDGLARTQHESTEATDVFGLCATLWHLATGQPPFVVTVDSESRRQAAETMLERQKNGVASEQISRVASIFPPAAVELLLAGLSFERQRRPVAASDLSQMLADALPVVKTIPTATISNASESPETKVTASLRKNSWRAWAGAAALLLIMVITLTTATMWNETEIRGLDIDDAGATGTQSPPAQQTPEAAFNDALPLIETEKFAEAIDIVQPYLAVSQDCRLVDLYCRTCRLQSLTVTSAQGSVAPNAVLRDSWNAVRTEWQQLVEDGVFPAAAWLNIAYIELEFSDFKAADEAFQQALRKGLPAPEGARMQLIVDLQGRQDSGQYPNDRWLHELEHNVLNGGSRGEFLALLTANTRELDELASVESPENKLKVEKVVNQLFKQHMKLVGEISGAAILLKCRAVWNNNLQREVSGSLHRTEPPPPHRLHHILLFPGHER